jgi:predicted hotdog family 3-hydroxylacyl-ACP dehydratase
MLMDRSWIAARIPHHGDMCLLEQVLEWDAERVRCRAISHRDVRNPLCSRDRLAAVCGIEYAAQAMAVHGALLAQQQDKPRAGFLASVRNIQLAVERLDDITGDLMIEAERFSGDGNSILYDFRVYADERLLLSGRTAVVLNADAAGLL